MVNKKNPGGYGGDSPFDPRDRKASDEYTQKFAIRQAVMSYMENPIFGMMPLMYLAKHKMCTVQQDCPIDSSRFNLLDFTVQLSVEDSEKYSKCLAYTYADIEKNMLAVAIADGPKQVFSDNHPLSNIDVWFQNAYKHVGKKGVRDEVLLSLITIKTRPDVGCALTHLYAFDYYPLLKEPAGLLNHCMHGFEMVPFIFWGSYLGTALAGGNQYGVVNKASMM